MMAALRHPNILQLLGVCTYPPCVVSGMPALALSTTLCCAVPLCPPSCHC